MVDVMSWYDDEEDDSAERELDLRVEVSVREPFATTFRLTRTHLYDLLNNIANALGLPRHGFTNVTQEFLDHLYRIVADEFEAGDAHLSHARHYAARALSYVEGGNLESLLRDLGWLENLYVRQATLVTFDVELREQFARRMGSRIERMLRRLGAPGAQTSASRGKRRRKGPRRAA